jgi:uncharacterized protein (DUF342 family)
VEEILQRLARIEDKVDDIKVTSAQQEEQLKEHMRRTEIAEENINRLRAELKPVQKHLDLVQGISSVMLKAIVATAGIIGLFEAIRRIFG